MKTAIVALFVIFSVNAAMSAERVCPTNVLTCKLEKVPYGAPRVLLAETQSKFDGTNTDEPSLPADQCVINTVLTDDEGFNFFVNIGEVELMTSIFATTISNPGKILNGDTSFNATPGKAFFYRIKNNILTCTLSK